MSKEEDKIEKLLKWLIENCNEYQQELARNNLYESVETVEYLKKTIQQFLDNFEYLEKL